MNPLTDVNWPPVAAAQGTHQQSLALLHRYFPSVGARVLDLPCGAGAFASAASQLGYDVHTMDIHPNEPYFADETKRVIGDANQPLPFANGYFDAVCSIEGIEHLENPTQFVRELYRVLTPGGYCVLSTPNVDSYRSRHNTLWRGYHRYFRPESDTEKDSGHMHPIDLYFMMGAMKKAGFEMLDLGVNNMQGRAGPTLWREFVRKCLSGLYPSRLREKVPFYGDVLIYVMRKPA
ncbi:class I SAM-dependent methyltransferase [Limnobacter sp.]|uniref:class I SAM-dependent methyltransferase n=1 Tax=Limnobacter sp. TaxID=2003368 RepID=UPI003BAD9609